MKGPAHTRAKRRSPSRAAVARARGHGAPTAEEFLQKFEGTSKWQPSACRYQRLLLMTWTPAPAWRTSRWQHAAPGAAAAARLRHQHVRAGCSRRPMCRQRGRRVNARTFICTSLARCATTAQLCNHGRTCVPCNQHRLQWPGGRPCIGNSRLTTGDSMVRRTAATLLPRRS